MSLTKRLRAISWLGLSTLGLLACGAAPYRPPAALAPIAQASKFTQIWQNSLDGSVGFPLQIGVTERGLALASSAGVVAVIDAGTGADLWRARVDAELSAGVGFDGKTAVVSTTKNELIAFTLSSNNKPIIAWRKALQARVYTAPLVAGGRVFLLAGDRTVQAFDAQTGAKLWHVQRNSESLILSQSSTFGVYQNTLLVGNSGRLMGLNPDNGEVQWEVLVATSRATNDIERLIDLVGAPSRLGDSVCVRSFQTNVSCVDVAKKSVVWSKPSLGFTGVSGDAVVVVSTESDGRVKAWSRTTGQLIWLNEKFISLSLSAPLLIGGEVILGDTQGNVHVLSKMTGNVTESFKTDGTAIIAAPVAVGHGALVVTANGGIYAYGQNNK